MKLTAKYNLKKGIVMGLLAALPMFNACEKPNPAPEPTPVTPTPVTPTTQKHNVELIMSAGNNYQNIAMDTIRKYNDDPTVDTIFMVPENIKMWATVSTNGLKTRVDYLRERHNVNPNKVLGKGDLELYSASVEGYPEIVRFFADTLKYNVVLGNNTKTR